MTAEAIGQWMQNLAWFAAFVGCVIGIFVGIKKLRAPAPSTVPQPFRVSPHVEYVPRPEFEEHKGLMDERLKAATDARRKMHETNVTIGRELASLKTTADHTAKDVENLSAQVSETNKRIDNLPARIAELVKSFRS